MEPEHFVSSEFAPSFRIKLFRLVSNQNFKHFFNDVRPILEFDYWISNTSDYYHNRISYQYITNRVLRGHIFVARRPQSDKLLFLHEVNHRETKTPSPPSLKLYCPRRHYYIIYSPSGDESRTPFFIHHTPACSVPDPLFVGTVLESSFNYYRPTFFSSSNVR